MIGCIFYLYGKIDPSSFKLLLVVTILTHSNKKMTNSSPKQEKQWTRAFLVHSDEHLKLSQTLSKYLRKNTPRHNCVANILPVPKLDMNNIRAIIHQYVR